VNCRISPAHALKSLSLADDAWSDVSEHLKRLARWFQSRHNEPAGSYGLPLVAIAQTQLATYRYDKPRAQRGTAAVGAAAQAQQALQQMRDMPGNHRYSGVPSCLCGADRCVWGDVSVANPILHAQQQLAIGVS
jgi:hypothetical protein